MKYEFDTINVGDVVKVKGTVTRKFSRCMEISTGENTLQVISVEEISDLLPPTFKAGDKIRVKNAGVDTPIGTVMAVDGEVIWVNVASRISVTQATADFEIVPPQITAAARILSAA